jgi:hypothetical protein
MRSFRLICSTGMVAMALITAPRLVIAQQEIESDAGEIVLNATINAIDVENQMLTVTGPQGNTIVVKAAPEVLGRVKLNEQITIRMPTRWRRHFEKCKTHRQSIRAMPSNGKN